MTVSDTKVRIHLNGEGKHSGSLKAGGDGTAVNALKIGMGSGLMDLDEMKIIFKELSTEEIENEYKTDAVNLK